jgi:hypothetical protein
MKILLISITSQDLLFPPYWASGIVFFTGVWRLEQQSNQATKYQDLKRHNSYS